MSDLHHRVEETQAILARIARDFSPAVFASSLAADDMVLTDLILKAQLPIGIFSLETGRLHAETLNMLTRVQENYGYEIALYRNDDAMPAAFGHFVHVYVDRATNKPVPIPDAARQVLQVLVDG